MSTSKQARILQSINDFFAVECSRQKPQPCSRCGCLMQLFEGHFWLYGTEMRWNMPAVLSGLRWRCSGICVRVHPLASEFAT